MFKKSLIMLGGLLLIATQALSQPTTFTVRIENVSTTTTLQPSDGSMQPVPLAPGVFVLHTTDGPLFSTGQPDRGLGLEGLAEDGVPGMLAEALKGEADVLRSAPFATPVGASAPGPLTPGNAYEFSFNAEPGMKLSFATMFVPSNDLFYSPDDSGIDLFDGAGQPIQGDVTNMVALWDAGTEANEEPGVGPNQAQRQSGPNTGPADSDDTVRLVSDGFTYPDITDVIRVTITAQQTTPFIVRIEDVSRVGTLQPSDGSMQPVPLSPGVWALHDDSGPLFTSGEKDPGDGLEAIAEDGMPGTLAGNLAGQPGILDSDLFNTPDGAANPGPLLPLNAYEFVVHATPGQNLSFASMFVPSNDLFFAPDENGIPLFDSNGNPRFGDLTEYLQLWDAGSEANEEPGVGPNQVQRQSDPDTGPADPDSTVRLVNDGFTYPDVAEVIRLTVTPMIPSEFTVRIENVSTPDLLSPSDGSTAPIPLSPGVWVTHNSFAPLFRTGQPDRGEGLEGIAEDGSAAMLGDMIGDNSGILFSGVFDTPVGAANPMPALPGNAFEFDIEAYPGAFLSFASMFAQSNDAFYAPDEAGIPLFDDTGQPKTNAEVTMYVTLWDAGTEANEEPGVGTNQAPRQPAPNTGPVDPDSLVRLISDGFTYPEDAEVIRVVINPSQQPVKTTLRFGETPDSDFSGVTSDAYIDAFRGNFNMGATKLLRVGHDGILASGHRPNRALIKFDFIDALRSAGVTSADQIVTAHLDLQISSSEGDDAEGITVDVFRVLKNWSEGETDYESAADGEVTWNSAKHGDENWSMPGAGEAGVDRARGPADTQRIDGTGRVRFRVTQSVKHILGDGENFGWLLQDRDEDKDKYYRIVSSEHPTTFFRPRLVIIANVPSGSTESGTQLTKLQTETSGLNAPEGFQLDQNYPNPFNPETVIRYSIPKAGEVKLAIYNTLGQRIRLLVNNVQSAGQHQIRWRGRDDSGVPVSSGTYFYRLESNGSSLIGKMSLVR